jgi:hypothetical protein
MPGPRESQLLTPTVAVSTWAAFRGSRSTLGSRLDGVEGIDGVFQHLTLSIIGPVAGSVPNPSRFEMVLTQPVAGQLNPAFA